MADNSFKINKSVNLNPQTGSPANPVDGDIYYDSTIGSFVYYHNGSWANFDSVVSIAAATSMTSAQFTPAAVQNSVIKITGTGPTNIHGFSASFSAKRFALYNNTNAVITIKNQSATEPTVNNRIVTPTSGDLNISVGEIAQFMYDIVATRWLLISISSNTAASSPATTTSNGLVSLHQASGTPSAPLALTDGDIDTASGVVGLNATKQAVITSTSGIALIVTTGSGTNPGTKSFGSAGGDGVWGVGGSTGGTGVFGQGIAANATGVQGTGFGTGPGVRGDGGSSGGVGVRGQGAAGAAGVNGVGGSSSSSGVLGTGGTTDGVGVEGQGTGSGAGVLGQGNGSAAPGVQGTGGSGNGVGLRGQGGATNGSGVVGNAAGNGTGVVGTGGSSGGAGVVGNGNGVQDGVRGIGGASSGTGVFGQAGATNGTGVQGTGAGTGPGVNANGGTTSGTGVHGTGGAPNGIGVQGSGVGNGYGGSFTSGSNGGGVYAKGGSSASLASIEAEAVSGGIGVHVFGPTSPSSLALLKVDGWIDQGNATIPTISASTASIYVNPKSYIKAYGYFAFTGNHVGGTTIINASGDGMNIATASIETLGEIFITFVDSFGTQFYNVTPTLSYNTGSGPTNLVGQVAVTIISNTFIKLTMYDRFGTLLDASNVATNGYNFRLGIDVVGGL